jgi:RHS repeat-associated protein
MRSTSDYSGFGVQLDGRTSESEGYRYGFNGMEKDDEIKGPGNSYDFGARMYDARVGRFLTMDAFSYKYPYFSPFVFAGNMVINSIDINGDSVWVYSNTIDASYGLGRHMFIRLKTGDRDVLIEMSGPAQGQKIGQVKVSNWNNGQLTSRSNVMFHQVWEPIDENNPEKFEEDIIKYAEYFQKFNSYDDINGDGKKDVVSNPLLPNYDKWGPNSNGFAVALGEYAGGNVERKDMYVALPLPEILPGTKWSQMEPYFKSLRKEYTRDEYYQNTFGMTLKQYQDAIELVNEINQVINNKKCNPSCPSDKTKVANLPTANPPTEKKKQKSSNSGI